MSGYTIVYLTIPLELDLRLFHYCQFVCFGFGLLSVRKVGQVKDELIVCMCMTHPGVYFRLWCTL